MQKQPRGLFEYLLCLIASKCLRNTSGESVSAQGLRHTDRKMQPSARIQRSVGRLRPPVARRCDVRHLLVGFLPGAPARARDENDALLTYTLTGPAAGFVPIGRNNGSLADVTHD